MVLLQCGRCGRELDGSQAKGGLRSRGRDDGDGGKFSRVSPD
jgi:hypothetical protein